MNDHEVDARVLFFSNRKGITLILVILFLLAGIGIRLIDFTDLPMDFAVIRQFHSLILSRGMYYQMETPATQGLPDDLRQFGITAGKAEPVVEPPILENLVALTYRLLGSENILVGRIYSILFWVIGGIPLFLLTKKMISTNGAFGALAFYLFAPFGIYASRSFQPEPMMIMAVLWALYFQKCWSESDTLKNSLLAGLFTGLAILVKTPMVFFAGIPFAVLVMQKGFKNWVKNGRVYFMVLLSLLPAIVYYGLRMAVNPNEGAILESRFIPQLLVQFQWYVGWIKIVKDVAGHFALMIGLFAFFLIPSGKTRLFYGSLWLSYILYGFLFDYHIYTHNYYHLPLLFILAIGFGYAFALFYRKLEELNPQKVSRFLIIALCILAVGLSVYRVRRSLVSENYRDQAAYWTTIGKQVGRDHSVIGLTQDNGYPLSYWGYINSTHWPQSSDELLKNLVGASDPEFQQLFRELTVGKDVFLITDLEEYNHQPELQQYLSINYPVIQGEGYLFFDLAHPLEAAK